MNSNDTSWPTKEQAIKMEVDHLRSMIEEPEMERKEPKNQQFDSEIRERIRMLQSKGMQFKEVFVLDCEMSDSEKYIAYTRALVKLNVIHFLGKEEMPCDL